MTSPPPLGREPVPGEVVERETTSSIYPTTTVPSYYRAIQFVWFLAGLVDVLIGLRFLLKLFGASTASAFVTVLYGISNPLVAPFDGIFPVSGRSPFIFEPASLVAVVIYPLIALGIVSLIRILSRRRTRELV